MNKYFKYPLNWNSITTYFSSSHLGIDLGWNSSHGGANVPVYASTDGIVVMAQFWGTAGNTVRIRYDDPNQKYSVFTQYKHLSKFNVKVGDKVVVGQQIGNMGNTGSASTGTHLHFDYVKTPYQYNYTQSSDERAKYSLNPVNYLVLGENQTHGESAKGVVSLLGTSKKVDRDTSKNQIEVIGYQLRVRKGAGTNQTILGYVDFGIYDYTETKVSNGYQWYNLGFGWIAGTKEDTKIYPKENSEDDKDKKIAELEEQVKKLDTELLAQKTLVEKQKKEIDQLNEKLSNYANLKEHNATSEGYIKLYKDDKIYF